MYFKQAIENSPLQAYTSALLFSPTRSITRIRFQHEAPRWVTLKPAIVDDWNACLQTLEGHSSYVMSIAFSHDSTRLASASGDKTVKIWDASSGKCVRTLETGYAGKISFSSNDSSIHTDRGSFSIAPSPPSDASLAASGPASPQHESAGLSADWTWITYNGEKVLWIPPEYRPSCSAVSAGSVGIGGGSGKVWLCSFADRDPNVIRSSPVL